MNPMSDIPVGSPPAPPGRHAAPGGWYPDPLDASRERYWDGWQWARDTREGQGRPPYHPTAPAPASGPYAPGPYAPGPWQSGQGGVPPRAPYGSGAVPSRQAWATADGVPLAGWWWRALAGLIDSALTGVVTLLLTFPVYRDLFTAFGAWYADVMRVTQSGGQPPVTPNFAAMVTGGDQLLVTLATFAIGMAYHLPFLRARGATLGLLACGLRVVPLDEGRSTQRLSWPAVLVRCVLWVLPGALGLRILTVADVLLPLWHPKRQTLHDLAARTQVVRTRNP
jgi:uncharacterized RDD family membrane protein YckC